MKTNNYLLFIYACLLGILTFSSCKKEKQVRSLEQISKGITFDPIKTVSIDKDGIATITTISGKVVVKDVRPESHQISDYSLKLDSSTNFDAESSTTQTFAIPLDVNGSLQNTNSSSIDPPYTTDEASGAFVFTYTIVRYSNGYSTVTVWPTILYNDKDDYTVRATVLAVVKIGHEVIYDVNFVFTRAGAAFQTTQVTYYSY